MKKLMMSLLMSALTVIGVYAQSGTVLIYGSIAATSQKSATGVKTSSFTVSPAVGYQFNDHWTAGLTLSSQSWKNGTKSSTLGVGPFIRYAVPLSDIFAVYGQFNATALSGKTGDVKTSGFGGTFFPAIGVNMKNGFALNFSFGGLSFSSQKPKGASASITNVDFNFGSGAGFGISKNF
ncbi:outer membrane beta-barrel protein [Larkinella bovis]|uniref:Outer membrane beta-barrel protein n=1 Tax=Larkinella bovis TaxID=683041 RepID=A0ABW0I5J6_9BACT